MTDALGAVTDSLDFAAFGERRAAANPQAAGSGPNSNLTRRGFTGHEQFAGLNIIHMNGRIYDPSLGRFMQADPLIQAPANAQSWNAYTYVFNNPLAYTDPSGLWGRKEQNMLRMAVAIAISVWTGGIAAPYFSAAAAGGAGAAAAFGTGMAITAGGGFAAAVVASNGSLRQGLYGAFSSMLFAGIGSYFSELRDASGALSAGQMSAKIAAHALAGGIMDELQGGRFGNGFLSAGLTAANADVVQGIGNDFVEAFAVAVVGGTASELTGGKFANGALTATFSYAFNQIAHAAARDRRTGQEIDEVIRSVSEQYPDAGLRITGGPRTIERQAELMAQRSNADLRTYVDRPHIRQMIAWREANPGASLEQTSTAFGDIIQNALANGATVSNHLSDTARDVSYPRGGGAMATIVINAFRERGLHVISERGADTGPHLHLDWDR